MRDTSEILALLPPERVAVVRALAQRIGEACAEAGKVVFVVGPGGTGKAAAAQLAAEAVSRHRPVRHLQVNYFPYGEGALEAIRSLLASLLGYSGPAGDFPWRQALAAFQVLDSRSVELARTLLERRPADDRRDAPPSGRPAELARLLWRVFVGGEGERPAFVSLLRQHWSSDATAALLRELWMLLGWRPVPLFGVATVDDDAPEAARVLAWLATVARESGPIVVLRPPPEPELPECHAELDRLRHELGPVLDAAMRGFQILGSTLPIDLVSDFVRRSWRGDWDDAFSTVIRGLTACGAAAASVDAAGRLLLSVRRPFLLAAARDCRFGGRSERRLHLMAARALADHLNDVLDRGERAVAYHLIEAAATERAHKYLLSAAETAALTGDWVRAVADLDAAERCERESGRLFVAPRLRRGLLHTRGLFGLGRLDQARQVAGDTLRLARDTGEQRVRAAALELSAQIEHAAGAPEAALDDAERALDLYVAAGDRAGQARCHAVVGRWTLTRPADPAGLAHLERAVQLWQAEQDDAALIQALCDLAVAQSHRGAPAAARGSLERAEAHAAASGDIDQQAVLAQALGRLLASVPCAAEALRWHERALELARRHAHLGLFVESLLQTAALHLAGPAPGLARPFVAEARTLSERSGNGAQLARALSADARLQALCGADAAALALARRAVDRAGQAADDVAVAEAWATLGELQLQAGHAGEAVSALRRAVATPLPPQVLTAEPARLRMALGDALVALGRLAEARRVWREAEPLAARAGAEGLLETLRARLQPTGSAAARAD